MANKRGLGLVAIIILILLLVVVLSVIVGTVIPAVQKLPETGKQLLVEADLVPAEYYKVDVLQSSRRAHINLVVLDRKQNSYITDFHPVTGYKVSEDGIPVGVKDVSAYQKLHIAVVVDSDSITECKNLLGKIKGMRFANTYVDFFSAGKQADFKNKKDVENCAAWQGNYWGAVAAAAKGLPSDPQSYNVLMVISDGCTQDCGPAEAVAEATQGLVREDINYAYGLTQDGNNCKDKDNALNTTISTVRSGECFKPQDPQAIATALENTVRQISVSYIPKKGFDGKPHKIRIKATKQNLAGTGEGEIVYA